MGTLPPRPRYRSRPKNQHAALGRLELLNGLVADEGLGVRNVGLEAACDFIMPFSDSASDKIREAATPVTSLEQYTDIAAISANSPEMGAMVANAIMHVGADGSTAALSYTPISTIAIAAKGVSADQRASSSDSALETPKGLG